MAETLTIEIPIEAVDRTGAGVQSATRNLTAFERAWDRTQRRLDRLERAHNIDSVFPAQAGMILRFWDVYAFLVSIPRISGAFLLFQIDKTAAPCYTQNSK